MKSLKVATLVLTALSFNSAYAAIELIDMNCGPTHLKNGAIAQDAPQYSLQCFAFSASSGNGVKCNLSSFSPLHGGKLEIPLTKISETKNYTLFKSDSGVTVDFDGLDNSAEIDLGEGQQTECTAQVN